MTASYTPIVCLRGPGARVFTGAITLRLAKAEAHQLQNRDNHLAPQPKTGTGLRPLPLCGVRKRPLA